MDEPTLRANWEHQLAYQLPKLPPIDSFLADLPEAIAWWLEPDQAQQPLPAASQAAWERPIPRQHLPAYQRERSRLDLPDVAPVGSMDRFDKIRYAARNRLCAEIVYHGSTRVIEPYSLRSAKTGNTLLYAYEVLEDGLSSGRIKAYNVAEIQTPAIMDRPFAPRHSVEL